MRACPDNEEQIFKYRRMGFSYNFSAIDIFDVLAIDEAIQRFYSFAICDASAASDTNRTPCFFGIAKS
jgi:hypothetical protein